MMIDHIAAALGGFSLLRLTITRAALPIFCIVAGHLLRSRDPSPARFRQLLAAAFLALLGVTWLPFMARIDILAILALAFSGWPLIRSWPKTAAIVGITSAAAVPILWDGYHPGLVIALLSIGTMVNDLTMGSRLPPWFALPGRWPLTIYLAHLPLLYLLGGCAP